MHCQLRSNPVEPERGPGAAEADPGACRQVLRARDAPPLRGAHTRHRQRPAAAAEPQAVSSSHTIFRTARRTLS